MASKKWESGDNKKELEEAISDSLKFFDDVVIREELYRMYLQKMKIQDEIKKL